MPTATCPSCGYRQLGMDVGACYICQRPICKRCGMTFGYKEQTVFHPPMYTGGTGTFAVEPSQYFAVCSWGCFDRWAAMVFQQGQAPAMNADRYQLAGLTLYPAVARRAADLYSGYRTRSGLDRAQKMLQAEDYEGAARQFEDLGMWSQAAEARRRDHTVTQVQVNVNQLIEQLKASGVTTDYTCPTCGSRIPISGDTNLSSLATCSYCGSVIRMTDLVDLLTKVVGSP